MFLRSRRANHLLTCLIAIGSLIGSVSNLRAEPTLYFDEAAYLSALSSQGLMPLSEGFENDDSWGLVRSTIVGGSFSAPDLPSQGITWTGGGGGVHGVTTSNGAANSGDWGFYSSPHYNIPAGINDGFTASSAETIYGFAGHIRGTYGADIILILDGDEANPVDLGETCTPGPGDDETCIDRTLGNTPFVGLIDVDGFTQVEVRETEADDEAKLLFSDDFTFGFSTLPSPRTPGIAWTNISGGVFATGSNWNGGLKPTSSQNALFDLASATPYTVTFNQIAANKQAVISNDDVIFDFAGYQYQLTETNLTRESLIVGELAGDNASLAISNGNLIAENAVVAHSAGSNGDVTVGSGALLAVGGQLRVGSGGTGSLTIENGGITTSGQSIIGRFAGSGTVGVHGSASSFSSTSLVVGQDGAGTVAVDNGADLLSSQASVAVSMDSSVTLNGAGTSWTNTGSELNIGRGDQGGSFYSSGAPGPFVGTVNVENSAVLDSKITYIGRTRTGRGVLNVTGPGSTWLAGVGSTNNNTFIGYEGDGEVNITQGATAQTSQTFVGRFGIRDELKGVVNIDGSGSDLTSTSTIWVGFNNDPSFYSGAGLFFAEGNVNVTNGGTMSSNQLALAVRRISKGVVNISGDGSIVTTNSVQFGKTSTTTFTYGSNAEMTIADGGLLNVSGDVDIYHGVLTLDAGTVAANTLELHGTQLVNPGDPYETGDTRVSLAGNGQINANVVNHGGYVEPGLSAGALSVLGSFTQDADGTLIIELGGIDNSGPLNLQYDHLAVDGTAILGGSLDVELIGSYMPQSGDSYDIITATSGLSGTFDTLNLPALSSGLQWQLNPGVNTLSLEVLSVLTADFNESGFVDDVDLGIWESSYGSGSGGDADGDGISSGLDFLLWQQQYTGPGPLAAASAVPEPSGLFLLMSLMTISILSFGRRRERFLVIPKV
jgi:T5SS/PEP-CTERM-associated repeat protein